MLLAYMVLNAWFENQPSREAAYQTMGRALVKTGLKRTAEDVLGFKSDSVTKKSKKRKRAQKNRKGKRQKTMNAKNDQWLDILDTVQFPNAFS